MKLNQEFIRKLRNGEIAVENNGTREQLIEVIKVAFPEYGELPTGGCQYYERSAINTDAWTAFSFKDEGKPTVKISDFYQPELFTGWAKDDSVPRWMSYFKDGLDKYGFDDLGNWFECSRNQYEYSNDKNNRPATHKEIEKALIKEAKRRGYKKGNYKCLELPRYTHDVADVFYYNEEKNKLHHGEEGVATNVVFKDGQWAEIIEQPSQVKTKRNPIKYLVDGTEYSLDYQDLKLTYDGIVSLNDEDFMQLLPQIAHLACIVSYFKGLGVQATISDKGIVHELIHLMVDPNEPTNDLQEIRKSFNEKIKLA